MKYDGPDRRSCILGTNDWVVVDRHGDQVFDLNSLNTGEFKRKQATSSTDPIGSDSITDRHFANLIAAIHRGEMLRQAIEPGNVATMLIQRSNIAWQVARELRIDVVDGKILDDPTVMKYFDRQCRQAGRRNPNLNASTTIFR